MSKVTLRSRTVLGLCALLLSAAGLAQAGRPAHRAGTASDPVHDHGHHDIDALLNMHDQEIHFTENKGQFSPGVLFRADFPYGQAVATPQGMVVTAFDPVEVDKRIADGFAIEEEQRQGRPARELTWRRRGHAWQLRFVGGNATVRTEGRDAHPEVSNYFVGDRQATDVRSFQEVWYRDVYPGIDVRYYPAKDGSLEYDLIVMPGADAGRIAIAHDGIGKMRVNEQGELLIETLLGELAHPAPYVYQRINGKEIAVASRYTIEGANTLRFELGAYDKRHPLVIDPIAMRWATWINTNSSGDNHGHCIWVDPTDGAIYVVARVVGTTDQITPGAFDETANGNLEMIVGKYLEPSTVGGSGTRVWQTYIGGGGDDNPYAMEQGPDGNLYITGQTSSTNFPLLGGSAFTGSSINQQAQSDIDIFVLKINTAGNSIKAAVVGGNGADDNYDVRLAANGDVFVAGSTTSTNLSTLNSGSGASNTNNGGADVLLFRINQDLSSLVWMRNYGGSSTDRASIMLHNPVSGDLFVGGNTSSTNFPTVSPRQSTRGGTSAGFIQRLNGTTAATVWSSYFSSDANDDANLLCMEFNADRTQLYFGGVTEGLNSANITAGAYDTGHNGSNDFYVARMGIDQNFLGGTYVGGSGNEVNMMGLNVDQNNDVYVFGYSNSTNFPMSTAPNVPLQSTNQGSNDKVFFKLESDLSALEFSTYYGGTADDYDPVGERGIKFSNCRIYTIVTARSNNIPLTQGALNTTKVSSTSRYEPGLVVWANPPDLLGNSINYQGVSICPGAIPGDITGSEPSYVLPTVVRNNSASAYPSFGSAATYQWQISTDSLTWTGIPGATGQDLPGSLIGPIAQDTYIRRVIGGDACILAGAADQVVKVQLMTVDATVTNALCSGTATGSITATADGQAPFTYVWSNGQTAATAVDLAAGAYTVTVTDANGCSAQGTFTVGQPAPVSADINTTLDACNTGTGGATASGIGGTPGYGYTWSTGAVGPNLTNVAAGTYSVTVTDLNQCTATVPVTILGTVPPGANAGNDVQITCATGASVQLNGSSNTPGVNFAWTGPGIVSGASSASPTVNAAGTYVLVVTDPQSGCISSDEAGVTVNTTAPGATAEGGTINCDNACVQLVGGGNGSFVWSGPDGFTSTEQNPTVCAPGTYTLTVTGANGCTSTATAEVNSDTDAPTAEATGGSINCNLLSTQLQGSGDGTLAWTGPNGFTSSEADPVVNVAGTYTLTVTGANGCTSSILADVTISDTTASAGANGGEISCLQPSVQLQGASLTPNVTFAWSGPGAFTSTEQNPVVSLPGTYTLTVTGASIQAEDGPIACVGTAEALVTGNTDEPGAAASGGTITCNNACVTLSGSGNGSFAWSGPNGFTSTEQNPTVCAPGTYTLTATGSNGCTSTATAEVDEDLTAPSAQADGGTITCNNECVQLTGSGNGSFAWSGPNGFTSTEQNPTVCAPGTYTLTVTGTNGCTSTATAEVDEDLTAPGAQAAGGTLTCNNECAQLTGSGNGSFAWSGPNGFTSNEQNPTVCAPGTYTLTVTGTNGCTSTATAEVDEDLTAPGAQAAGGTLTCNNECVTLSGSGNGSFSWSGPDGFTSAEQNPTVCAPGTYTLMVTGTNGCTSTATAEVGQDVDAPGAQAAGGTLTCNNECVTLQGVGNGSYSWSGPDGFTSTEQNPTVCAPGTYTLTVTAANGCTSTATAEVGQDVDVPGAQAAGGTLTCNNECVTLQGVGNGSYSWSGPNGFTSTEQNPTVCAPGTYTLTVTGSNGCTSTATAEVGQDVDVPGAQAAGGTLTCNNACVTLQGVGNGSYGWSGPDGFTSTEQNPTVCAPGSYTLTVTGTNGCTSTATAEVGQDVDVPGAQAAGGTLTCNNECVTLQGVGNGSYSWSGPNGFTSTEQNPTVCAPGTYTLTVTGANGCTSTATAEVGQDVDVPGAQAAGGTLTCNNECVMLSGSGNGSFAWSGPNDFTSNEQNPTVCAPGTYTLTVTGSNGCTSTATAEVGQDVDVPGAQAAGGTITCNNECVQLGGSGNGSFAWSGPDGYTSTEQNPTVCAPGTYTLTVTGSNGCTSTAMAEVGQDVDVPGAQAAGGTLTCNNECVTLQGVGNGSYSWSGPDGFTSTEQNPTICAPGTYTLTVTGTNGCTSTATAEVDEDLTAPGAQADGGTITCNNECVQLTGSGNGSFSWSGPDGFTSNEQNPTVCAPGTYTLTVTGTNGCTSTATAEVGQDVDVPGAQAAGGTLTCNNQCVTLQGVGNGSYSWSGPDGFTSTEQNPTVCAPGTYTLTVTGANGCTSTATAEVGQDVDVPGAQAAGGTLTCNNQCVTLQGVGNGSYSWSGPDGFTSNEQNPTVCAPGTYTLTVSGTNGCTSTATAEVGQDVDVPGAQAAGGTLTCNNQCVTLQGVGNGSYSWSGPDGFTSTEQNPTVCAPGTYTLTVTGANGCTSTATTEVGQDVDVPVVTITPPAIVNCNPSWVWINATSSLPGEVVWTLPGGGTITEELIIQEQGPGIYTLTVTAANGCVGTAQTEVIYDQVAPVAEVAATYIGCEGEAATLSFTSTSSIFQIFWSSPNGNVISNGPTALADEPGIYNLALVGMNGCSNEFQVVVMQDPNCGDDCPPIIISCPPDITVSCAEDFSPFGIGGEPVWRKKQDCPEITSLGWNDQILSNCPYVIRRTFWAEDATGAYETCSHTITVIDDVAPILMEVPEEVTLSCDQNIDALPTPEVWAYDECTKMEVAVDHTVQYLPGTCPGTYTLVHTWTAVDQCGNVGQASWTINVVDEDAPQFTCEVEDMVVGSINDVPEPADCKAFDNCSGEVYVQFTEQVVKSSACQGGIAVVRTWYAVDACGNPATMQQTITVCDKKPGKDVPGAGVTLQDALAGGAKVSTEVVPNPFRLDCTIILTPAVTGHATVEITDMQGRKVSDLFSGLVERDVPVRLTYRPEDRGGAMYLYRVILDGEAVHGRLLYQP